MRSIKALGITDEADVLEQLLAVPQQDTWEAVRARPGVVWHEVGPASEFLQSEPSSYRCMGMSASLYRKFGNCDGRLRWAVADLTARDVPFFFTEGAFKRSGRHFYLVQGGEAALAVSPYQRAAGLVAAGLTCTELLLGPGLIVFGYNSPGPGQQVQTISWTALAAALPNGTESFPGNCIVKVGTNHVLRASVSKSFTTLIRAHATGFQLAVLKKSGEAAPVAPRATLGGRDNTTINAQLGKRARVSVPTPFTYACAHAPALSWHYVVWVPACPATRRPLPMLVLLVSDDTRVP